MSKVVNSRKAVMIGCGFVGSASVFALMQSGLFTEIVLIDADKNKAEGEDGRRGQVPPFGLLEPQPGQVRAGAGQPGKPLPPEKSV